jgi:pilus assembly protein CpaB
MKKYGAIIALVVAVVSGISAVYLANRWLAGRPEKAPLVIREGVPSTKIVVAARDCEVGMPLNQSNLVLTEWPKANVPQGAFENIEAVGGRVAVTRLKAGQPIISAELAAPGSGAGLVAAIKNGKRAISIRVDEVIGVGGFILPNTFVDIIAIDEKSGDKVTARTLLERIEVLAIAQETYNEEGKPKVVKTVTLLVDPEQAKVLALQTHKGGVQLTLRNPQDGGAAEPKPVPRVVNSVKRVPVLGQRAATPKAKPHAVEVIRRSQSSKLEFENIESDKKI